jgi:rod shape-determining protein MreC
VHDKQVRRRRAVLGLLVAVSLISLTVYFGESPSSPLHSVQRGFVEVLSPIQEGASKALKPVRDVAGWFSDTFHAKTQRDELRTQVRSLTRRLALAQAALIQNHQLTKLVGLDNSLGVRRSRSTAAPTTACT